MKPKIKTVLKIISNTLVILAVALVVLLHGLGLFGVRTYAVMSGSMASVYPTGSLIYVIKADPDTLKLNDVITFTAANGVPVTHRIVEFVPDEIQQGAVYIRTKGDENDQADGRLVEKDRVIGKVIFGIAGLGHFAAYISYPPGKYVAVAVALALILFELVISLACNDKDKNNLQ